MDGMATKGLRFLNFLATVDLALVQVGRNHSVENFLLFKFCEVVKEKWEIGHFEQRSEKLVIE